MQGMKTMLARAVDTGCDAVVLSDLDCFENGRCNSELNRRAQKRGLGDAESVVRLYANSITHEARLMGLSVILRNAPRLVSANVVDQFDAAIVDQVRCDQIIPMYCMKTNENTSVNVRKLVPAILPSFSQAKL